MIVSGADLFATYEEFNEFAKDWRSPVRLSPNVEPEHPALIMLVRKWSYEGLDPSGPDMSSAGLEMRASIQVSDKWDIFIYRRRS